MQSNKSGTGTAHYTMICIQKLNFGFEDVSLQYGNRNHERSGRQRGRHGSRTDPKMEENDAYLLIFPLDQSRLICHDLKLVCCAETEQLWQCEPLASHFVPIICIHELIIIRAVRRISLHLLDGRFAAVKIKNIVHQCLSSWRELERF